MKADEILRKHEDANEMHFHQVDRKWIIESMEEYANQQLQLGGVSNQRELLLAYEKWFAKETSSEIIDSTIAQLIDKFLSQQ